MLVKAKAIVTLTLQIENLGVWGDDCNIKQIYQQAINSARLKINKILEKGEIIVIDPMNTCRVILTEEKF